MHRETKLSVVRADCAGNTTLFVLTPVPTEQRAALAQELMQRFDAEQVGYACEADSDTDGAMEMCGGEFCGNASRAYGALLCRQRGLKGRQCLTLRVSGSEEPVCVEVEGNKASVQMPQPRYLRNVFVNAQSCTLVHLGGIAHLVAEDVAPSEEFFFRAEQTLFRCLGALDAYGVTFLNGERLTPLVRVPAVNSLIWEGSCASGTLSAMLSRCVSAPDGTYCCDFIQPAGTLSARLLRLGNKSVSVTVSGDVALDAPLDVVL